MPEYPPRLCTRCRRDFRPTTAGQDECVACMINPKTTRRSTVESTKVCAKDGCERTFVVSTKQPRRVYCDIHYVGHKGTDKPKRRQRTTEPREEQTTGKKPLYTMTGVDPKMSSRLSVMSEHLIDIEFGDDFVTFHSPGIKIVVG